MHEVVPSKQLSEAKASGWVGETRQLVALDVQLTQ